MESLGKLFVATFDLVEAEGRSLKRSIVRLALAMGIGAGALVVAILGIIFLLLGIYRLIAEQVGPGWAGVIFGLGAIGVAGGLLWWARLMIHKK
jgi:hypothetical protein